MMRRWKVFYPSEKHQDYSGLVGDYVYSAFPYEIELSFDDKPNAIFSVAELGSVMVIDDIISRFHISQRVWDVIETEVHFIKQIKFDNENEEFVYRMTDGSAFFESELQVTEPVGGE